MTAIEQHNLEIHSNAEAWRRKPLLRDIYDGFYARIAAELPPAELGPVVELGSGMGNIKRVIPQCITTDLFSNEWLDRQENAYALSFAESSVGGFVLFDVFHHLRHPGAVLRELHRTLRPGGRVILFEPDMGLLGRFIYGAFHHEPLALLVQCAKCSTYYLNPRPTTAMLPQIYAADDYYSYSSAEEGNPIVLKARLARDRQKVTGILAALNRPASAVRAIDIGAGDGSLLEAFRSAGAVGENLVGTELAEHAAGRLNARGFRGLLKRAEELNFPPDSFDVVTMIQVIEHVANPDILVKHLGGMMNKGGILFLETPNMKSWDRRFFRKATWGGYHFPRHWTLWDPDTMTRMLNDSGFEVVSITTLPAAVVWVWSVNHVIQAWFGNGRIARFFSMNNPFALALFWLLELIPSKLGRSANMRIIARHR